MNEKQYWIWLSRIEKVGSIKKQKLLEKYKTVENIWNAKEEDLMKVIEPLIKTQRDLLLQQFKAIDIKQMVKDMGDKNGRRSQLS